MIKTRNSFINIRNELTKFLLVNQDDDAPILQYLSNIAISDSFATMLSCLEYSIDLVKSHKNEINLRSNAYLLIFLYLKLKLEIGAWYLHKLIIDTVQCPSCGMQTKVNIVYHSSIVCQNCGNAIKEKQDDI